MTSRLSEAYSNCVLSHPRAVLALLFVVLAFFAYHARNFQLDASADSLLLEDDKDLRLFREVHERYPSQDLLIVTFSPEAELFSDDSIAQLGKLRDELSKVEGVAEVVSMLDIPLFKNQDLPLTEAVKNIQKLADDGVDPDKARVEILESPIYSDLILSADARTTAVLINLQEDAEYTRLLRERDALRTKRRVEGLSGPEQQRLESTSAAYDVLHEALNAQRHRIVEEVRAIMAPYKKLGVLYLGGVPMITDDMVTFVKNDLIVFGAGVLVFLIAVLTLIFRQLRWIILPLLSCFYAGLVMIGVLGLIGWKVTVISSNFLALMLIITISMNIHLIVRYRQLRRDYPTSRQLDLVRTTTGKMVKPCLYTALTTIMGFSSLVVSDIKPVIDFGWMMSAGLAVTFLTSFLLFPAILVVLEKPAVTQDKEREFKLPERLATLTEVHGGKVLVLSIAVAALSGVGISRLKVENSFINYFSDSTEIYQGLKLIDRELGGTTPLEVILTLTEDEADLWYTEAELAEMGDEEREEALEIERQQKEEMAKPEYWFTPLKIERIKAAHDYLDGLSEVGKVMSLASVIRVGEDLNKGKEFDSFQLSLLYNQAPDEVKRTTIEPFVNFAHSEARILMRILDSKEDLRRKDLLDKVRRGLVQKLGFAEEKVTVTGLLVLYNNMLQSLFKSQISTLGVVMAGIAIMFLVLFRSPLLSVIGIVPNLLGALVVLGIMGWMDIPMDMMTITIAAITIGIAVDNGIHYIYRFQEEYAQNGDYTKTLHLCHSNIGKAVIYTTITIIFGFSILVLSNFIPTIYFGALTALAMLIALMAALTLLPKLILIWRPFGTGGG